MSDNYYARKLNSERLKLAYDTAIPRVQQYLDAEINFVAGQLAGRERLLEIGCGYGRILRALAPKAWRAVGVDIAEESIALAQDYLAGHPNVDLKVMDAHHLEFEGEFEAVVCLQNGLSAVKGDPHGLIKGVMKALVPGGRAYFSTYSPKFWETRLAWFQEQADKKLLGPIDYDQTGDGVIVGHDGFRGLTFSEKELDELGRASGGAHHIEEVDESSLFLIITKPQGDLTPPAQP